MINLPVLLALLIFIAILLFIIGGYYFFKTMRERRNLVEKIKHNNSSRVWETPKTVSPPNTGILKRISDNIMKRYVTKLMVLIGNIMKPKKEGDLSHLQLSFLRAGIRSKKAVNVYFGIKALLTFLLPLAFIALNYFLFRFQIKNHVFYMLILLFLGATGFYSPSIWLRLRTSRRKDRIFKSFPDMLDLLVVCVEAGVGLNAALYRVSQELKSAHKDISDELQILNWELKAGKSRKVALKALANRIDLEDVHSLVTLLIQTEKFGTSVAKALRVYSDAMRSRRYQMAEEMAAKIAVKLLFPLIFCIFPALFVAILGPALIQVLKIWKH